MSIRIRKQGSAQNEHTGWDPARRLRLGVSSQIGGMLNAVLLGCLLIGFAPLALSQDTGGTRVAGSVSVTNNGISSVPSFSLGEPAMIYNLSVRKGDLGFEPEFRWGLDGKPWVFLLWWRYRLQPSERFGLRVSAHPAVSFTTRAMVNEGVPEDVFAVRRYLAGELVPSYAITPHLSVSSRILLSRGFQDWTFKGMTFTSFNIGLSDIKLTDELTFTASPQVYYLSLDDNGGFYFTSSVSASFKGFPLSLASVFTKTIQTDIPDAKDILWNVSLVYAFDL